MDTTATSDRMIEMFHKERDKILDQLWTGDLNMDKIRTIIEPWTNQLLYHIIKVTKEEEQKSGKCIKKSNATNGKYNNPKQDNHNKAHSKREPVKEDKFANIVNKYHNSQYTEEDWNKNECKDCEHNENSWHTKSRWPKQGLHLVIHHLGNKNKNAYRNGFTIVKDPRFLLSNKEHWPMRIELEPIYDRKRKTKNYIVKRNEFRKREFYPKFFNRMKEAGLTLDNYQQILDANKDGLWKQHPMRLQKENNIIISTPLRFNLNKTQWKKVIETNSFKEITITRQLGRNYKNKELANEIIVYANEEGLFIISELDLENWRKANRKENLDDMRIDQAKQSSKN